MLPEPPRTVAMSAHLLGRSPGMRSLDAHKALRSAASNDVSPFPSFKDLSAPNSRSAQSVFLFPFTDAQCKGVLSNPSRALIKSFPDFLEIKRKSFMSERLAPNLARACNGI